MQFVNVYEAKTHLSHYLDTVSANQEEIIICRHGKPIAKLVKYTETTSKKLGLGKNTITIAPDFDTLPPDFLKYFS